MFSTHLSFSDGAKFALIARNLALRNGFTTDFSFWGPNFFSTLGISPLIPYSILPFFKLFGVGDFAVIASSFFYFLLLVAAVFLLGRKLFGNLVGILAALVVFANVNFLDYATSGASEPLFTFLMVLSAYFLTLRKRWATGASFVAMAAMYFSRPQAVIFIAGLILLWLILRFGFKKASIYFLGLGALGYLVDKFIIYPLSFKYPLTPVFARGIQGILTYSSDTAVSDALRGSLSSNLGLSGIFKKVFYNLYNFYKLLPQIMSPYLLALFIIGLFKWGKDRVENSLKIATVFTVAVTFLAAALTIPFFRYLHPVVPLVYLFATATLVWIVGKMVKKRPVAVVSTLLIVFLVVGQTLGVMFLDSRFKAARTNKGKPPVYVVLSRILKENTPPDSVIVTNLDTWGSWYGERKTIWYPLKPEQLRGLEDKVDAIYLTSYLIDDENYYMGPEWRQIFESPKSREDEFIAKNYRFVGEFKVSAEDTYEKQEARAILLIKKPGE